MNLERKLDKNIIGQMREAIKAGKLTIVPHAHGSQINANPELGAPVDFSRPRKAAWISYDRRRADYLASVKYHRPYGHAPAKRKPKTAARSLFGRFFGPDFFSFTSFKKRADKKDRDAADLRALKNAEEKRKWRREKRARK